jgi:hypothetical protein
MKIHPYWQKQHQCYWQVMQHAVIAQKTTPYYPFLWMSMCPQPLVYSTAMNPQAWNPKGYDHFASRTTMSHATLRWYSLLNWELSSDNRYFILRSCVKPEPLEEIPRLTSVWVTLKVFEWSTLKTKLHCRARNSQQHPGHLLWCSPQLLTIALVPCLIPCAQSQIFLQYFQFKSALFAFFSKSEIFEQILLGPFNCKTSPAMAEQWNAQYHQLTLRWSTEVPYFRTHIPFVE